MLGFDNTVLTIRGLKIGCHMSGRGLPPILLIHGFGSHSGSWRRNVDALGALRQTIAPSMPRASSQSFEDLANNEADLIEAMVGELGLTTVSLIGHSLGGWAAMVYAAKHPSNVCCLILEDTAGVFVDHTMNVRLIDALNRNHVPTLIVWGQDDTIIPPKWGEALQSALSGSVLIQVEGAGHVPHWEKPHEFNEYASKFISSNSC